MRWVRETPRRVARVAERRPWVFVAASIVFWTLLSPLALVWLTLWLIDRHMALDHGAAAKRHRRVTRLLRWYPPGWRARYGEEMAALLHDAIADGRGGPHLTFNVAKEGLAARLAPPARRPALAGLWLTLCWIPIFPQGLVPAVMKLAGAPTRSWFVALYLPHAYQWPVIAAMLATGLAMLRVGMNLACAIRIRTRG